MPEQANDLILELEKKSSIWLMSGKAGFCVCYLQGEYKVIYCNIFGVNYEYFCGT
jgi:hypothetical protein